jgi:hypothetical protein
VKEGRNGIFVFFDADGFNCLLDFRRAVSVEIEDRRRDVYRVGHVCVPVDTFFGCAGWLASKYQTRRRGDSRRLPGALEPGGIVAGGRKTIRDRPN